MATKTKEVTKSKKFAPPAGTPSKKAAPTVAKQHKSEATRVGHAPRAGAFTDDQVITVVSKENPYRVGTRAAATFDLFAKAKTVGKFKELAADKERYEAGYIRYSSRDGYIKIK